MSIPRHAISKGRRLPHRVGPPWSPQCPNEIRDVSPAVEIYTKTKKNQLYKILSSIWICIYLLTPLSYFRSHKRSHLSGFMLSASVSSSEFGVRHRLQALGRHKPLDRQAHLSVRFEPRWLRCSDGGTQAKYYPTISYSIRSDNIRY